jgi:hypothetical protein
MVSCYQCFGSGFIDSGSSILGWMPIRIKPRFRVLMTKNIQKFTAGKNVIFFWLKIAI